MWGLITWQFWRLGDFDGQSQLVWRHLLQLPREFFSMVFTRLRSSPSYLLCLISQSSPPCISPKCRSWPFMSLLLLHAFACAACSAIMPFISAPAWWVFTRSLQSSFLLLNLYQEQIYFLHPYFCFCRHAPLVRGAYLLLAQGALSYPYLFVCESLHLLWEVLMDRDHVTVFFFIVRVCIRSLLYVYWMNEIHIHEAFILTVRLIFMNALQNLS